MKRLLGLAVAACLLLGGAAWADQGDPRLDPLFEDLRSVVDPGRASELETRIWSIWLEPNSAAVGVLMDQGLGAMEAEDFALALESFDAAIAFDPDYAESWNQRATLHFRLGDYAASLDDIQRTLALEPRHFGAWSGLALIYENTGNPEGALAALERVRELHPRMRGLDDRLQRVRDLLDARNI